MSLPTPYYQDSAVTVYNCDWRDYANDIPKVDLLLTDPPYGIGRDGKPPSTSSHGGHKGYPFMGWDSGSPIEKDFKFLFERCNDFVVWGANYFCRFIPFGTGWMLWDKGQRIDQADGEIAASSSGKPLRIFTLNRVAINQDGAIHPTQKPVTLFKWCIGFFPDAETILDPYAGSLTTGVAAKALGKTAILFEREEAYCEKGVLRLLQEVLI